VVNRFDLARVCLPQGLALIRRVAGRVAGAGAGTGMGTR
jgi:hypothetical protein